MPTRAWIPAVGVAGAVVISGAALVAVAATGPSIEPTSGRSNSTSSATTASVGPLGMPTEAADPHPASPSTAFPNDTAEESIPREQAVQIAASHLTGVGELVLEDVELEREDGRMIWDVEFVGDHEAEIDAATGSVVELEVRDDDRDNGDHRDDDDGD